MTIEIITVVGCIGCGVAIGMYISSMIDRHIDNSINPKMNKTKKELGLEDNKDITEDNILHYYTYIKKEDDVD
tara:strand:+ start:1155 stop:1373 length:219 start_codon:yes stop_codon:yes gene_type:complete